MSATAARQPYTAPTSTLWLWASGSIAGTLMIQTFGLILPIFNTGFGLDAVMLGWVLMLPRLLDGIFDPLMGHMSDNASTKWGRRKPFLVFTTFAGAFLVAGIWWADPSWPTWWQFAFLGLFATAYYCNWGTFAMTHGALGYELTDDYHQRARVAAIFTVFTQLVVLAVGWTYWLALRPAFGGEINGIRWICAGMAVLIVATGLIPVFAVKERFAHANERRHVPMTRALRETLSIRPFRTFLAMRFFWAFGIVVFGQLVFYVNAFYVCGGDKSLATKISGLSTAISVTLSLAMLPLTTRISKLVGKRTGMIAGTAVAVVAACSMPLLYNPQYPYLQLLSAALFSPAVAVALVLRDSIVPDICDLDELQHGNRREALFSAVLSFVYKLEVSLCVVLVGYLIRWSGFDPKVAVQPAEVLTRLQWFAYTPNIVFAALALWFAVRFPVTEATMAEVRRQLDARRAGGMPEVPEEVTGAGIPVVAPSAAVPVQAR